MGWSDIFNRFEPRRSTERSVAGSLDLPVDDDPIFDEELLARLRQLVLLTRRAVAQGIAGEHKSRRKGASPEFSDFKSYAQGDDYRRIDWNIYSRLDSLFVRLSEVTTELTVHVLIDASDSMNWKGSSETTSKFAYARRLAGSLAYVSLWHFDRIVITPFSAELGAAFGPVQGRAQVQPALSYLTSLRTGGTTDLPQCVRRYTSRKHHPGVILLITDLLSEDAESLRGALRYARNHGWAMSIIHVADPAEFTPQPVVLPFGNDRPVTIELIDIEGRDRIRLTASEELLDRYGQAVENWRSAIEQVCIDEGADYIFLRTDWSFEQIVLRRLYEAGVVG